MLIAPLDDSKLKTLLLFLGVFACHALYFLIMRDYYHPDWEPEVIPRNGWFGIAQNVANGDGFFSRALMTYFRTDDLVPTAARGPVPILYLAGMVLLFSNPYYPILVATWLMAAGTAVLAGSVAATITQSTTIGRLTLIFTGLHLSQMYITTTFSYCSEPIFMFLLALAMYFATICAKSGLVRHAVLSGLCLGLAYLSKQSILFLPILYLFLYGFTQRKRVWTLAGTACLVFSLVQIPWAVRNWIVFEKPIVTTTMSGYGLYIAGVTAQRWTKAIGYQYPNAKERHEVRAEMEQTVLDEGYTLAELNEAQFNDILATKAESMIREHLWQYAHNGAFNMVYILYKRNSGRGLYAVQNLLYYVLCMIGVVISWRRRYWGMLLVSMIVAYFVLIHAPFISQYRYLLPVTPYLFIFAAVGVHWAYLRFVVKEASSVSANTPEA